MGRWTTRQRQHWQGGSKLTGAKGTRIAHSLNNVDRGANNVNRQQTPAHLGGVHLILLRTKRGFVRNKIK